MATLQQVGLIGNSVKVQSLPTPSAETFGTGNRFYTLIGTQAGYITGHTYRTIIKDDIYDWEDIHGLNDYDELPNKPIINADLDNTAASTADRTVLYHHIGESTTIYKKTSLYYSDGESWLQFESDRDEQEYENAGYHNSRYRGKDITSYLTDGSLWTRISSGKFTDLYIGDYFTISFGSVGQQTMRIASFDFHYGHGQTTALYKHHVDIVPDQGLQSAAMNDTDSTYNGYTGSAMYTSVIPKLVQSLEDAIGSSHVIVHQEYITNKVDTSLYNVMLPNVQGRSTAGWWAANIKGILLSETEVYGTMFCTSSGHENRGISGGQLPLFFFNRQLIRPITAQGYLTTGWLRTVASSSEFAAIQSSGYCTYSPASTANSVRPRFTIG